MEWGYTSSTQKPINFIKNFQQNNSLQLFFGTEKDIFVDFTLSGITINDAVYTETSRHRFYTIPKLRRCTNYVISAKKGLQ